MKNRLALWFLLLLPLAAYPAQERFYVGTYTGAGNGEGIYTGVLDSNSGTLGTVALAVKASSPNYLALSRDASHLYAVTTDGGGSVAAFSVGRDGALAFLNSVSSGGAGPSHLSLDASGTNILVANYTSGSIANIRINPDGSLGDRTSLVAFQGSGPDPIRQKKPFAHFIASDDGGRFVYACDLGTDHVWTYHYDPVAGVFQGLADMQGTVPAGSGPRHFAFGRGEGYAYVNGEMGRNVTAFRHDKTTGALAAIQTLPLVPGAGPEKGITTAEIECHPSGKWLYVSSRGDDIIAVFALGGDGRLAWVQDAPCMVKMPRGFGIDPSGRWLIVAGQSDGQIAVLGIDQGNGKLAPAGQQAKVPSAVDVLFVPAGRHE
jgi:6-phosphogluconolactonase